MTNVQNRMINEFPITKSENAKCPAPPRWDWGFVIL